MKALKLLQYWIAFHLFCVSMTFWAQSANMARRIDFAGWKAGWKSRYSNNALIKKEEFK